MSTNDALPAKLKITPYAAPDSKKKVGKTQERENVYFTSENQKMAIELPINPESFSVQYALNYDDKQGSGTTGVVAKWTKTPPRKLSFECLLDGTGAVPGSTPGSISNHINTIENTVFTASTDQKNVGARQPNFLWIQWGEFIFKCRLESMNITYKLFSPQGHPLRASMNMSFIEVVWDIPKDSQKSTASASTEDGKSYSDTTKENTGDPKAYTQVALENKDVQFRNVKPGKTVHFDQIKQFDGSNR